MSRKREKVRQCKVIRQLIDDNKYTKALELIDAIPLEEVGSLDDLYRYAELYEKAERMDKKKEIFYHIYHRTHSRYMLNRLLRLSICPVFSYKQASRKPHSSVYSSFFNSSRI